MASLAIDLEHRLRDFSVALTLELGAEVVALAGPSGAGKTTVLRCVAGLTRPDAGTIRSNATTWFDHRAGVDVAPERRSVGYVPQQHALFPHLTVAENVAFGGASRGEVAALLERFRMSGMARERPEHLSGGERQRVALARALARRPEVLLLDEPLAALDAHTRRIVRDELADELAGLGLPTLLVTHDTADATVLADRVAVLVDGTVRQLATPAQLLAAPADAFVVELTGGFVLSGHAGDGHVTLDVGGRLPLHPPAHGPVQLGLYPWDVAVHRGDGPPAALRGVVRAVTAQGPRVRVRAGTWWGDAAADLALAVGDRVHATVDRVHVVDPAR